MQWVAYFAVLASFLTLSGGCGPADVVPARVTNPMEFNLAWRDPGECNLSCVSLSVPDAFGTPVTVYAGKDPKVEFAPASVVRTLAVGGPGESWSIQIIVSDSAFATLAPLIRTAIDSGAEILFLAEHSPIALFAPDVFQALEGNLVFTFNDRERFLSAKNSLGLVGGEEFMVSEELLAAACLAQAGDNPHEIKRCQSRKSFEKLQQENELLSKIEDELSADNPNLQAITESLLDDR